MAGNFGSEGAPDYRIWMAEHAQEIADEVLRREHAEFLSRCAYAVDGDNQAV